MILSYTTKVDQIRPLLEVEGDVELICLTSHWYERVLFSFEQIKTGPWISGQGTHPLK